ncbi:MAG TPA: type II secretion system F family protein [Acidimicrobiia bacterium]|nr:type II secretion system F family protein [Acidimicrobiia bacterium]
MTLTLIALGAAVIVTGGPWPLAAILIAASVSPATGVAAIAAGVMWEAWRHRRHHRHGASASSVIRALALDMGAGRSLREALLESPDGRIDATIRRLCDVGAPLEDVGRVLGDRLGVEAQSLVGAIALSDATGSALAESLDAIADQMELEETLERDRRVATSQARFSALVVGVVPLAVAILVVLIRGVPEPGGAQIIVPMAVGATLMVIGSGIVLSMSRRVA